VSRNRNLLNVTVDNPNLAVGSSDPQQEVARQFFHEFYSRNPLQFAAADILCIDAIDLRDRLAELLIPLLFGALDAHGTSPISEYVIVLSPTSNSSADDELAFRQRLADVIEARRGHPLGANEAEILTRRIRVQRSADLEIHSVISLLRSMRTHTVVVICECALYRDPELAASQSEAQPPGATLEEDIWVPHMYALATQGTMVGVQTDSYVVFDVGEGLPHRASNKQLLMSVDPCGLAGLDSSTDPTSLLPAQADEWIQQVRIGRSDLALASIDAMPDTANRYKPRLKVQVLYQAGRCMEAVQLIRSIRATEPSLDPNLQAKFARFAVAGGDLPLARTLLASCLPGLAGQETLEQALSVALSLNAADLEEECLRRLEVGYPASAALRRRRIRHFLLKAQALGRRESVSEDTGCKPADVVELQHTFLAATAVHEDVPDYANVLASTESRWPALIAVARIACGIHALERGSPEIALACTMPLEPHGDPPLAGYAADLLLEAIHRVLLKRSADFAPETLIPPVAELIRFLAFHPQDASRRVSLARLLAVQTAGEVGLPLTALTTLLLSGREPPRLAKETSDTPPAHASEEVFLRTYRAALGWAQNHSPLDLGQSRLPVELLELPADEFLPRLERMAEIVGEPREGDSDLVVLEQIVVVAALTAPNATARRNDDLEILRFASGRFALAGRHQKTRDFAEQALQLAGNDPLRARLAWYTFADGYHRVNNLPEALLGMACALACDVGISSEQAWYEANGLIRLLRDIGMTGHALSLIPVARALLEEMGQTETHGHRLDTLELSMRMLALRSRDADPKEFGGLLRAIVENYRRVSAAQDELAPVTMLLAQTFEFCRALGVPIDEAHRASLDEALNGITPDVAAWIRATSSPTPSPEDLVELARRLQAARYSDDVGFDVRAVVLAAARLLSSPRISEQPQVAAFGIEMMTDHAVTAAEPSDPAGDPGGHWLASSLEAPATAAEQLAQQDIDIALLGLTIDDRLVNVTFRKSVISAVVREEPATFSIARFREWTERYPYGYGSGEEIGNLFYTSLQGVGTTLALGVRALLVMATPLQVMPPNLLLVNGELAGRTTAMASAPSLSWLTATRRERKGASGRRSAWIPTTADNSEHRGTLGMVAERLESCLTEHRIRLNTGSRIPDDLTHSDLVIVAAHGRISPDGSYFQSIANDATLRISPVLLARTLAHTRVVILFVCSGGRTDKHPFASTTVGLPKELLDRNCSAVVASPWPLDARVPSHWLPAFLRAWYGGAPLIDANFEANKAVERAMGDSPALCLAMNVYGDPLAKVERDPDQAR
jgi:hypothetical protein